MKPLAKARGSSLEAEQVLSSKIQSDRDYNMLQMSVLENKTMSNFKKLQDFFNSETTKLKLDLETNKKATQSEISDISQKVGGLEEKSSELDSRISEINVQSSDFSSIANDVIKAVVSVKTSNGQASGVIFDSRGYIMTNRHVVEGVSDIKVYDYNADTYDVEVIGVAKSVDLAVLKIVSNDTFSYLKFEDISNINVGERVIAVGNPLGLSFTVTEGIISALDRNIDSSGVGYLQTDVSINPGNSGGPLVDSSKMIVGINTLKISDTEGLGFAIPCDVAENIAEQV